MQKLAAIGVWMVQKTAILLTVIIASILCVMYVTNSQAKRMNTPVYHPPSPGYWNTEGWTGGGHLTHTPGTIQYPDGTWITDDGYRWSGASGKWRQAAIAAATK